jgi:hypothetical protein
MTEEVEMAGTIENHMKRQIEAEKNKGGDWKDLPANTSIPAEKELFTEMKEVLKALSKQPLPQPVLSKHDQVECPVHYTSHPSGIECIEITRHMNFNLGNAIKYIWRADSKGAALVDLEKAAFYIRDEIARRKNQIAE